MEKLSNIDLINGLKKKDRKCYNYLYHNYSAKLYGIALHITQKADIAEDVLQETFIKVFKYVHKFDDSKGTLFTWMLNICRNGAIDKIRYGKESKKIQFDSLNVDMVSETNPEIELANAELWNCLNSLDKDHKEILKLSYYYGYSHSEISKKLGMPFGSVKSKIRIAIRELRKIYP
ncbi:MAG: RNA polymerase subunit sigma-70 [Ignavibacteriae bacterium HGW-Ignavibacteriae-4]|nr:MAG: RNA polymerase subunit sigma-70 [Ignavibacteriae bacterium HGW-Ignavibacteriae-4]